ncbi:MAG: class I SAM-dependent methyltransferase [Thermoplasmata archaeon]
MTVPDSAPNPANYTALFYELEGKHASTAAPRLVPAFIDLVHPTSVLDVGCGTGVFLREFLRRGISDVVGIEGRWAETVPLEVPRETVRFLDLNAGFDLGRTFDLVLCLEVAEHIEPENADRLVDALARHGPVIALSAAVPSQGGEHHVNEQWPDYWARKLRRRGFDAFDPLRTALLPDPTTPVYYAQNLVLYARPGTPGHGALRRIGPPLRGRVPFRLRVLSHPVAGRLVAALPSRLREQVYLQYRTRVKRHMPGRLRRMR